MHLLYSILISLSSLSLCSPSISVPHFSCSLTLLLTSPSLTQVSENVHISWESPTSPSGKILEYSMYLAVNKSRGGSSGAATATASTAGGELAFIRIYRGTKTSCTVNPSHLSNAHIDCSARPAVVFRIAAKNEQGYGPATQIRWLPK